MSSSTGTGKVSPAFPQSTHSRPSADWSHSTNFHSAAFSKGPSRVSSSTFAVTSVDVPDFGIPDAVENPSEDHDSVSLPSTTASLSRQNSISNMDVDLIGNTNGSSAAEQKANKLRIAQRETRQICFLRALTLSIFALAAVLVSIVVNSNLKSYQTDQFEDIYGSQAGQILNNVEENLVAMLTGVEQFSFPYQENPTFTAHFPMFQERIQSTLRSTQSSFVAVAPVVDNTNRSGWELNSQQTAAQWLDDSEVESISPVIVPEIDVSVTLDEYALPIWQHSPTQTDLVNWNIMESMSVVPQELYLSLFVSPPTVVLGSFVSRSDLLQKSKESQGTTDEDKVNDESMLYFPIVDSQSTVSGVLMAALNWTTLVQPLESLGASANGIIAILRSSCRGSEESQAFRLETGPSDSTFFQPLSSVPAESDLLIDLEETLDITQFLADLTREQLATSLEFQGDLCAHSLQVVPTEDVHDYHSTRHPAVYTGGIAGVFLFCSLIFLAYDCLVERRQRKVMKSAAKTHEIVAGLFPENVRNRLFGDSIYVKRDPPPDDAAEGKKLTKKEKKALKQAKRNSPSESETGNDEFISPRKPNILASEASQTDQQQLADSRPAKKAIADLFPNTTVMFADIAGFTAWSSVRDPSQVFTLLETIYAAFDKLAAQRSVFKVETIGDCYVAVTGLPHPQDDHAVIMVKFARDCLRTMQRLTQKLEVELGPDTGDLCIRVGLHSGPVTAGVLRGQKSRFQLFGDTVNTASRMESNGLPNQIQCSQQTADLLISANKQNWIHPRKEMVHAKGKGLIQTYWILAAKALSASGGSGRSLGVSKRSGQTDSVDDDDHSDITEEPLDNIHTPQLPAGRQERSDISPHLQRLIDWNVDTLSQIIKTILASRQWRRSCDQISPRVLSHMDSIRDMAPESARTVQAMNTSTHKGSITVTSEAISSMSGKSLTLLVNQNPRDEYCEAIKLPHFDASRKVRRSSELQEIELDEIVTEQLREYVTTIACAYNDHPFHNFEHASHVTMSANKILKRVVDAGHVRVRRTSLDNLASKLHNYTYGITSDPLTHFACLFSAMIQ